MFESNLEDRKIAKTMIKNFSVPKYFKEDILQYVKIKILIIISRWEKIIDLHIDGF